MPLVAISPAERIDALNIGLMLLSCGVAMVIPFELFLFSYAILGPLHYLTEISWLHDKKYFSKGKYDGIMLLVIGLVTTIVYFSTIGYLDLEFPEKMGLWLVYIAFLSAAVFALVKNNFIRIAGIVLIILSSQLSEHFMLFLGVFLPTLIHVYVFTGLFMLYGALKSKSRLGVVSVFVLLMCPVILFIALPNMHPIGVTDYSQNAYTGNNGKGFWTMHITALNRVFGVVPAPGADLKSFWINQVFHSKTGILVMRFIAFAYTYHYLNWFSKTSIIQWHKVPRSRFILVVLLWTISIALFVYDYTLGLTWLFFLSYLHVILEFPLNYTSVVGIGRYFQHKIFKPAAQRA